MTEDPPASLYSAAASATHAVGPYRSFAKEPRSERSGQSSAPAVDTASYIADMAAELATMARRSKLDLLAYFLEMARLQASTGSAPLNRAAD